MAFHQLLEPLIGCRRVAGVFSPFPLYQPFRTSAPRVAAPHQAPGPLVTSPTLWVLGGGSGQRSPRTGRGMPIPVVGSLNTPMLEGGHPT